MVHNVTDAVAHGVAALLFDLNGTYYWNQSCEGHPGIVRCLSWDAVADWILVHTGRVQPIKIEKDAMLSSTQILERTLSPRRQVMSPREHSVNQSPPRAIQRTPIRRPVPPDRQEGTAAENPPITVGDQKPLAVPSGIHKIGSTQSLSRNNESTETLLVESASQEKSPDVASNDDHKRSYNGSYGLDSEASLLRSEMEQLQIRAQTAERRLSQAASVEETLRTELRAAFTELEEFRNESKSSSSLSAFPSSTTRESPKDEDKGVDAELLNMVEVKLRKKLQQSEQKAELMETQLQEFKVQAEQRTNQADLMEKELAEVRAEAEHRRQQAEEQMEELQTEFLFVSTQMDRANKRTEDLEQKLREAEAALDGDRSGLTWCVTELRDQLAVAEERLNAAEARVSSSAQEHHAALEAQKAASNMCLAGMQNLLSEANASEKKVRVQAEDVQIQLQEQEENRDQEQKCLQKRSNVSKAAQRLKCACERGGCSRC
eukprot:gnl/MRDRNA2_/MRDRNA2_19954_c0_seq1.p1 gnl/MRDRNA2_/MRDRNA2_19954_c0~~gnl/MRDRNA2_/MRDRNA2_19954_c0_seq1.p1  ORF type:complete len:518 (+),score=127.94 gnl/MRDRNA2_/MRDRNA2_19954_c0_seq1:89-1555(+)